MPRSSQSTALNNSRIQILRARNDHLNDLFDEAAKQVNSLASGSGYAQALENLILEVSVTMAIQPVLAFHSPSTLCTSAFERSGHS